MPTDKEIKNSTEAEMVLNSDVFTNAIQTLKEEYTNKWINSDKPEEKELREALHQAIRILPEVERQLRIVIERGKITQSHINKIKGITRLTWVF